MSDLLQVKDLTVCAGQRRLVDGVTFTLNAGESLGIAGESGSGKTLTALSLARLHPPGSTPDVRGTVRVVTRDGEAVNVPVAGARDLRRVRGGTVGMIFQDPGSALNPVLRVGTQICEGLRQHRGLSGRAARQVAVVSGMNSGGAGSARISSQRPKRFWTSHTEHIQRSTRGVT